jgi:hypothetical protein
MLVISLKVILLNVGIRDWKFWRIRYEDAGDFITGVCRVYKDYGV